MGLFDRIRGAFSPNRGRQPGWAPGPKTRVPSPAVRRDRMAGAMLGVHAGDSLGATLEFKSASSLVNVNHRNITGGGPFGWKPGDATDDTDLTAAVVKAYVDGGDDLVRDAADNMHAWYRKGPKDIGGTTSEALRKYGATGDVNSGGSEGRNAANGSLMRCIGTGVFRWRPEDTAIRRAESEAISRITHAEPRAIGACIVYNDMVAGLIQGKSPNAVVNEALATCDELGLDPRVKAAIELGTKLDLGRSDENGVRRPATPEQAAYYEGELEAWGEPDGSKQGYACVALALSTAAVLDPRSAEDILIDTVHVGGDTDTNGAIVGGIVGVRDGASGLPARWRLRADCQGCGSRHDVRADGTPETLNPGTCDDPACGGVVETSPLLQYDALFNKAADVAVEMPPANLTAKMQHVAQQGGHGRQCGYPTTEGHPCRNVVTNGRCAAGHAS